LNKKDLTGFMNYACKEAQAQAEKNARFACVDPNTVYGWAIHFFEEDSIECTLYNEDGTEYKPPKPAVKPYVKPTVTASTPSEPKPVTLFDLMSGDNGKAVNEETVTKDVEADIDDTDQIEPIENSDTDQDEHIGNTDTDQDEPIGNTDADDESNIPPELRRFSDTQMIDIAASPADLIREGDLLSHCVGKMNYGSKMAREETLIFFVRDVLTPDIPFVTVEYSPKQKRVLQCYGYDSKKPDEKVLHYVHKVWQPYANKTLKKLNAA
jgi:hypothetical protein